MECRGVFLLIALQFWSSHQFLTTNCNTPDLTIFNLARKKMSCSLLLVSSVLLTKMPTSPLMMKKSETTLSVKFIWTEQKLIEDKKVRYEKKNKTIYLKSVPSFLLTSRESTAGHRGTKASEMKIEKRIRDCYTDYFFVFSNWFREVEVSTLYQLNNRK